MYICGVGVKRSPIESFPASESGGMPPIPHLSHLNTSFTPQRRSILSPHDIMYGHYFLRTVGHDWYKRHWKANVSSVVRNILPSLGLTPRVKPLLIRKTFCFSKTISSPIWGQFWGLASWRQLQPPGRLLDCSQFLELFSHQTSPPPPQISPPPSPPQTSPPATRSPSPPHSSPLSSETLPPTQFQVTGMLQTIQYQLTLSKQSKARVWCMGLLSCLIWRWQLVCTMYVCTEACWVLWVEGLYSVWT